MTSNSDQMFTSFSSKSEFALNLSTDDNDLDFMGYVAPVGAIDVSNSNTPGAVDSTNPVTGSDYRAVAQLDQYGNIQITETNAYSGNNGRAVIVEPATKSIFTAGNAGTTLLPPAPLGGTIPHLMAPTNKQVVRGVSFAPSTSRVMACSRFGGCRPSPWTGGWAGSPSSGPGGCGWGQPECRPSDG